jgi:hypothetical protein
MGALIHAFKKCCPPDREPSPRYPRQSFSINIKKPEEELYEVVDVPDWGGELPTVGWLTRR